MYAFLQVYIDNEIESSHIDGSVLYVKRTLTPS